MTAGTKLSATLDRAGLALTDARGRKVDGYYGRRELRRQSVTYLLADELGMTLKHVPAGSISAPARRRRHLVGRALCGAVAIAACLAFTVSDGGAATALLVTAFRELAAAVRG